MKREFRKALVIDDESSLREIIIEVLSMMGIASIEAEDGEQALEVAKESKDEIDIILLDLNLPKLSGDETYVKLQEIIPGCPAIFMSGYDDEDVEREQGPDNIFLKKPFTLAELKSAINSINP